MEERKFEAIGQPAVREYISGRLEDPHGEIHLRADLPFSCLLTTYPRGTGDNLEGGRMDLVPTLVSVTTYDSHGALLEFWEPSDKLFLDLLELNSSSLEALGISRENNLHIRLAEHRNPKGKRDPRASPQTREAGPHNHPMANPTKGEEE